MRARAVEIHGQGPSTITISAFQQCKRGKVSAFAGPRGQRKRSDVLTGCASSPFFAKGEANGRSTMHVERHLAFPATLCMLFRYDDDVADEEEVRAESVNKMMADVALGASVGCLLWRGDGIVVVYWF